MMWSESLPCDVVDFIRTRVSAEFATVNALGVPIDTPTYVFPSADLSTLDIATGLAYPIKAERARRNPKVGMLLEGAAGEPVVSIAGHAAVRDADLQANLERYLAETIFTPNINPDLVSWSDVRGMSWYLTRILVCVAPTQIRWWKSRDSMDEPPMEWRASRDAKFAPSDPAPRGRPSEAPAWPQRPWQDLRARALTEGLPGHLTLLDVNGFPAPIRATRIEEHHDGFSLDVCQTAPWSEGEATLSFVGKEIFVGAARREGDRTVLRVDRALPVSPLTEQLGAPNAETLAALTKRLQDEMRRRDQPIPRVPQFPPTPTEGARIRREAALDLNAHVAGGGT